MTYQPLARKYRPATFEELVGQDVVSLALGNAIRLKREPNGVIFSGVRGVGKTTLARLYAKALNCDKGPTAEPCNTCPSCLAISVGNHEDVLEIDGASNTSVDDVRSLRETVGYVTQRSPYKIYIIDEVHMLSQSAFNALLKTLEEPPRHVVFMFATTELHKVPQTIVSRCQTFYLQKIPLPVICQRLTDILTQEQIEFEEQAVAMIARQGHGSLRDALTLTDQAIAIGGGRITVEILKRFVQTVSSSQVIALLTAILAKDPPAIAELIHELDQSGVKFASLLDQLAAFARHGFVIAGLGKAVDKQALFDLDDNEFAQMQSLASEVGGFDLHRLFRSLMQCREELDGSELDRFVLENYAFEWCCDPGLPDIEDLIAPATPRAGAERKQPALRAPSASAPAEATSVDQRPRDLKKVLASARAEAKNEKPAHEAASETASEPSRNRGPQTQVADQGGVQEPTPPPLEANESQETKAKELPGSWRELVDLFKEIKPLQARIFEETYEVEYSPTRIVIAVDESSLAGKKLLDKEMQTKTLQMMQDEFGFAGALVVKRRSELGASKGPAETHGAAENEPEASSMESLIDVRRREKKQAEADYLKEVRNDPVTKTVLQEFGGEIEGIELLD